MTTTARSSLTEPTPTSARPSPPTSPNSLPSRPRRALALVDQRGGAALARGAPCHRGGCGPCAWRPTPSSIACRVDGLARRLSRAGRRRRSRHQPASTGLRDARSTRARLRRRHAGGGLAQAALRRGARRSRAMRPARLTARPRTSTSEPASPHARSSCRRGSTARESRRFSDPVQFGARFSMNAVSPSLVSADAMTTGELVVGHLLQASRRPRTPRPARPCGWPSTASGASATDLLGEP